MPPDPEPPGNLEGVIEVVAEKAIALADGNVIETKADTKYLRLTDKGEQPAERKELKAGDRVRYEFANGKAATKVVILPVKQDNKQDNKQEAAGTKPTLRITGRVVDAERFPLVTHLQHKLTAKIPEIAWGEVRDGLRMAIVVRDPNDKRRGELTAETPIPLALKIRSGEAATCQLIVENVSDHDISLFGLTHSEFGHTIEVLDSADGKVAAQPLPIPLKPVSSRWRLRPRERYLLQLPFIHFGETLPDPAVGFFVKTASGDYTMRWNYTFGGGNKQVAEPDDKTAWIGTLTTAALKVTVSGPAASADKAAAKPMTNAGRAAAPIVHSVDVRLVGGPKSELLPKVKVDFTSGHGSDRKSFGTFRTDEAGWLKATLPVGFYYLHLSSEKEWPYLTFEKFWGENGQGQSKSLNVRVTEQGVEKWLGGERREKDFEAATAERPARITFNLEPAVEFVLRAVDIETGKGITGADFYEEVAAGEDWAHSIYGENLGSKFAYGSKARPEAENLTDNEGYLRRWVSDKGSESKFGVWKAPAGYELVEPKAEISILTKLGQARAEQVFKFRRIQRVRGTDTRDEEATKSSDQKSSKVQLNPPPVVGDSSKIDDPDVLLDLLAKSQLHSLVPQTGGGFFHQPGTPPQMIFRDADYHR